MYDVGATISIAGPAVGGVIAVLLLILIIIIVVVFVVWSRRRSIYLVNKSARTGSNIENPNYEEVPMNDPKPTLVLPVLDNPNYDSSGEIRVH